MHTIQQKLLRLADTYNIGNMSLRDVAKIIDVPHPQIVKHHLEQLERRGLIEWDRENKTISKKSAGISSNSDFNIVPVLGAANCGHAEIFMLMKELKGISKYPAFF
jgi:SOS-response transcriptional repressor LexA